MSIYEKTNVARALLYWAKNNNGNEAYYLEDRMYAVADGDMVIILTADSYDEAIRKANGERPQGEWIENVERRGCFAGDKTVYSYTCPFCGVKEFKKYPFCHCGADLRVKDELGGRE